MDFMNLNLQRKARLSWGSGVVLFTNLTEAAVLAGVHAKDSSKEFLIMEFHVDTRKIPTCAKARCCLVGHAELEIASA